MPFDPRNQSLVLNNSAEGLKFFSFWHVGFKKAVFLMGWHKQTCQNILQSGAPPVEEQGCRCFRLSGFR
jgi:hypothetical protein